jgi:hypothetical protein
MRELSKVVRQRLKAKEAATAVHPDADLLTAFAEQSLTGRERSGVMEHLAQCGDCREVVALALPAEVEETVVAKGGVRSNWFRLPALRWAAVAVGIAAAISVGTLEYRNRPTRKFSSNVLSKQETVAALTQPPSVLETQAETAALPSQAGKKLPAKKRVTAAIGSAAGSRAVVPSYAFSTGVGAGTAGRIGGGSGAGKGVVGAPARELAMAEAAKSATLAGSAQTAVPAPSRQMPPAVSETVEVAAANPAVQTEQAELGSDKLGSDQEVFSRAKPAVDQQTVSGASSLPIQGGNATSLQALSPANAAPRWTIGADGALQRSFDGGTTWEDVNVRGDDSKSAEFTKSAKSAKAVGRAIPVFRVVSVNGAEVWAGGSGGTLYHTVDAGNSWARVGLSYEGVLIGGDIISIEFPDPQHGRVATSAGEIWTTGDRGQTWLKLK